MIYDNTYLFSKRKSVNFILRKEVEEILNEGIFLQQQENEVHEEVKKEIKKKRFDIPEKKEFIKKKQNRRNLYTKSKYLREFLDEEKFEKLGEEDEATKLLKLQEKLRDEKLENNLNEFIDRIKNLKKRDALNSDKIDDFIDQRLKMDDNEKDKKEKENRINEFMTSLNDYRKLKKQQRILNDTFVYKEPIMMENLMIDNYEVNNISFGSYNDSSIKSKYLLKYLDKIKTQYSNKRYTKKNNNSYCKKKSYLTEIYY